MSNRPQTPEHQKLVAALREVFTDNNSQDRPILINRIPFICNDIRDIKNTLVTLDETRITKEDLEEIRNDIVTKDDFKWIKWLVMGIVGGIGLLALKMLGA